MIITFGRDLHDEDTTGSGALDVEVIDGGIVSVSVFIEALDQSIKIDTNILTDAQVEKIMSVYWQLLDAEESERELERTRYEKFRFYQELMFDKAARGAK